METKPKPVLSTSFTEGDAVLLEGKPMWVTRYNGVKCLKYPGILGWCHIEPLNWGDVKKLTPIPKPTA